LRCRCSPHRSGSATAVSDPVATLSRHGWKRMQEERSMKIAKVEAIPVSYPEPNDFDALRHLCLVKLTADDGQVAGASRSRSSRRQLRGQAIIEGMASWSSARTRSSTSGSGGASRTAPGGTGGAAASRRTRSRPSTSPSGT
jgi:hypothetical protein